jgi:AcrR family transcriptional regulator
MAGRPRSAASRRAALDAAYGILVESGLARFSVDAVAARSGVARTTIYRWWPSKGVLAIESFLEAFEPRISFERSGDAERDFRVMVGSLASALSGEAGRLAASVVAQAQSDEETRRLFAEQFSEPLRRRSAEVITAGVDQGVFRRDLDVARVIDAYVGAIYFRLLVGSPLDAGWADALADTLLRGCSPPR